MILKLTTSRGPEHEPRVMYLDHLTRVQCHGPVCTRQPIEAEHGVPPATRQAPYYFGDQRTLVEALDAHWGGNVNDSFAHVYLPELDADRPMLVTEVFAEREDGKCILVCVADDAFLMSDDGKTVDRLR